MAILAILVTIAYPSYQEQVRKTRRAEGQGALVELANVQQQFFSDNPSTGFADRLTALGFAADTSTVPGGNYTLRVEEPTGACPVLRCFVASVTAIGAQAKDTKCAVMSISNTGVKTSKDSSNNDTTAEGCWRN